MDINFEKGTVTLFGKSSKFDTLIRKFAMLSGEQAYHFLINRGIQLPRRMNCLALMSVLNKRIKFLNSHSLSKDYFSRLKFYSSFSEQQLFNLFVKICNDPDSFYAYRYNLFKLILTNFVAMDFSDGELSYIKNLKKANIESFEQYFNYISGAALEQEDTFDGQDKKVLFDALEFSASNQEIIDIAGKYGYEIPQSLKKDDYLGFIFWYMQGNNTYNDEVAEGLREMTVGQLDIFTKRMNIPMTSTLSKKEMITYLSYLLDKASYDMTSIKRFDIPEEYKPFVFTVDLNSVSVFGNGKPKKVIHYKGEDEDKEEFKQVLIAEAEEEEAEEAAEAAAAEEKKKAEEEARLAAEEEKKRLEQEAILESIPEDPGVDIAEGETYEFVDAVYEDPSQKQAEEPQEAAPEETAEEATEEVVEYVPEEPQVVYEDVKEDAQEIIDTYRELTGVGQGTSAEELEEQNAEEPIILDEDLSDVESASDEEIAALLSHDKAIKQIKKESPEDPDFKAYDVEKNELYGSETIMKYANNTSVKTILVSIFLGLSVIAAIIVLIIILLG